MAGRLALSMSNLTVERDIRPPFALAVTLPLTLDGQDLGISVYVTTSVFTRTDVEPAALRTIARSIAEVVNAGMWAGETDPANSDYARYLREFPHLDPRD